jgi:hypothetical protein
MRTITNSHDVSTITTAYLQLICSISDYGHTSDLCDSSPTHTTYLQLLRVSPINMQYLRLINVSQIYATHHQPTRRISNYYSVSPIFGHTLRRNCFLKHFFSRKDRRCNEKTTKKDVNSYCIAIRTWTHILEVERGRTRSHCVETPVWKRLWTCRKTDHRMNESPINAN